MHDSIDTPRHDDSIELRGSVTDACGHPLEQARIMLVSCANVLLQYRATTDDDGRYTVAVPPSAYDVIFDADGHAVKISAGAPATAATRIDCRLDAVEDQPGTRLSGALFAADGAGLAGWKIATAVAGEAGSSGSTFERETATDGDGSFGLDVDGRALLMLTCTSPDGSRSEAIPVPKPNKPVHVDVLLGAVADERTARSNDALIEALERGRGADAAAPPPPYSEPFTVSYVGGSYNYQLRNGLMKVTTYQQPIQWLSIADETPASLAISAHKNVLPVPYAYSITLDNGSTAEMVGPTSPAALAPDGNYAFTDQSPDTYHIWIWLPHLHVLNYNSSAPDITAVDMSVDAQVWPA